MHRRTFLTDSGGATIAMTMPPSMGAADDDTRGDGTGGRAPVPLMARRGPKVGKGDVRALRDAAEATRHADSRYGGGSADSQSAAALLVTGAAPLLGGDCAPGVERALYSVVAQLARLAGWAAFDTGRHGTARGYFRQALYLARQSDDTSLAAYILATMGLQAVLCGRPADALDMTGGADREAERVPRVRAFTRLVAARAYARQGAPRAASAALAASEELLARAADKTGDEPRWIDFFTPARLAADAAEIYRDLGNPRSCFYWDAQAAAMAPGDFTRSVGMRFAVVGCARVQTGDLDQALALGHRSADILGSVDSRRAQDYLRALAAALGPWSGDRAIRTFLARVQPAAPGSAAKQGLCLAR
jgi:tetratricopeptide (TPR) repeat protein